MTEKLLAEWFLTDRWMGSSGFLLPMEARGLYREMLTQAWRRGARLPNDYEAILRATGCTKKEWERSWPKVAPYWHKDGSGEWLVNDTQVEVYGGAQARAQAASKRGLSGAQARAQALLKIKPPSPSPSPSTKERKNGTSDQTHQSGEPPPTAATPEQASERALSVLGPPDRIANGPRKNPLMTDRVKWESECLELVRRMSALTGEDGAEVIARASGYNGALRTKLNPASMTDDRLMNTVLDLRSDVAAEEKRRGPQALERA